MKQMKMYSPLRAEQERKHAKVKKDMFTKSTGSKADFTNKVYDRVVALDTAVDLLSRSNLSLTKAQWHAFHDIEKKTKALKELID